MPTSNKLNIRTIINRILPPACLLCGVAGSGRLCSACHADLPWHTRSCCPVCATPTPAGEVCGACLKRPPAFARTHAALAYRFPLDRLIPRLKYHGQLSSAPVLADSLAHTLTAAPRPDCIVPMPLHPARIRERGFNHATEIARGVAHQLDLRLDPDLCRRVRDTPPQMALKLDARRRNVRGAFACTADLADKHIAVVDDVMTTGTSLDELAATLKRAGAREVSCWVVARALPPGD